jgi:hypothetical protein
MVLEYSSEGLPIILDVASRKVKYKDTEVSVDLIKEAFESGLDKVQLTKDLDIEISNEFVTFGCLTLTKNQVKQLIKLSWKQLNQYNKVGN